MSRITISRSRGRLPSDAEADWENFERGEALRQKQRERTPVGTPVTQGQIGGAVNAQKARRVAQSFLAGGGDLEQWQRLDAGAGDVEALADTHAMSPADVAWLHASPERLLGVEQALGVLEAEQLLREERAEAGSPARPVPAEPPPPAPPPQTPSTPQQRYRAAARYRQ